MIEVYDVISEVCDFIYCYKFGIELVEKYFKEDYYNIRILCRKWEFVENKIESIIKGCDW